MTLAPIHRAIFPDGYVPSAEGALHVGIKDTFDIAGLVTSCGSRALTAQEPARADADVVARLKSAGCTVAGHTGMHELAYGVTGLNSWCGTPCNPHYPELIPGGSSSGSAAAVAAGLVDFALGTDTGGSVRIPATCCGVVGLKPTFGRVSRAGVIYEKTSLDCVGPFARDVAGIEQAMAIMVADWTEHADIHPAKVAYISSGVDAGINALTRGAAAQAFELEDRVMDELETANDAGLSIIARETWLAVGYLVQSGLLGDDVRQRLRSASAVTDAAVTHAEHVRERFTKVVDELLGEYHALAMPAMPCAVPTLREAADANAAIAITALVRPFNLSGHPAISLPVGQVEGRPVSLQLIGRKDEDEALCALARRVMIYDKEKDHGDST